MRRREFIRVSAAAGGGLLVAFSLPVACSPGRRADDGAEPHELSVWVRIDTRGRATITVDRSEMGQGALTGVAMLLADELDIPWEDVRIAPAPTDPQAWVRPMGTGGSQSIRSSWVPVRTAGAAAREILVAAAARRWEVDPSECVSFAGRVLHSRSDRSLGYGEVAEEAARLPAPEEPRLKHPSEFRLIGTSAPRVDTPPKVNGAAVFGMDVKVPGAVVAVVERSPVLGGRPLRVNDADARAVEGVRDVLVLDHGVAVLAEHYWPAMEGRRALEIEWDEGDGGSLSDEEIRAELRRLASRGGAVARDDGNAAAALGAARRISAEYELPYLSHSPMEPMNCTAHWRGDECEVWAPTQVQSRAQSAAARVAGLPPERVRIHTTYLGGGFGRRLEVDYVEEAVDVSRRAGLPVKVIWTREDDTRHGFYRPSGHHRLEAGVDADGRLVAWTHRVAAPSILRFRDPGAAPDGVDRDAVAGAVDLPYAVPNVRVECALADFPVRVGFWRAVGHTQNGFVVEAFLDEVIHEVRADPVEYRLALLADHPRDRSVIELAADRSRWSRPLPEGHGRGIGYHHSFGSRVAQVVEVSTSDGGFRVHRVVTAVDCGVAVHPDQITAQMESTVVFGLSAALRNAITLENGRVRESNFHDHPVLRMDEMPRVEVHIVPSREAPGGIGEPGIPPLAAAVANALYDATGRRIRRLPLEPAFRNGTRTASG